MAARVRADVAIAVVLGVAAQLEVWAPRLVPGVGDVTGEHQLLSGTALVATSALALRRRAPLAVLLVVLGTLSLQQLLTTPTEGLVLLLTAMVAAYSSSAFATVPRAAAAGAAIVGGAALMGSDAGDWAFITVVLGGAWLTGFVVLQRSTDLLRVRADNLALAERLAAAVAQLVDVQRSGPTGTIDALTGREVEVARAIAGGLSNAEIAAALFISEWTVKTHVASILRKLGLRDRAQVVVAAYESGLVVPGGSSDGRRPQG